MHIVFVLGNYYPYYSAVGKCLGNLADELGKNHQISVVSQLSRQGQSRTEQYHSQSIIRVTTSKMLHRLRLEEKRRNCSDAARYFWELNYCLHRVKMTMQFLLSPDSLDGDLVQAYVQGLENIKEPIDLIVPTCNPFDTVAAAMQYKESHPEVMLRPVLFDKFADSETLHRIKINKRLKWKRNQSREQRMFQVSDAVLHMPTWTSYIKKYFPEYLTKTFESEHPLIVPPNDSDVICNRSNDDGYKLIYCGTLIKGYVEPYIALKIAEALKELAQFEFDFYASGNGCNVILKKHLPNVNLYGWIEKKLLNVMIRKSDICLSIAEINGEQISSKIFEYMSFGKPIIHVYYNQNDVNLDYLRKYPLAFYFYANGNNFEEQIDYLVQWCKTSGYLHVPFIEINIIFKKFTPAYVSKKLISGLPE